MNFVFLTLSVCYITCRKWHLKYIVLLGFICCFDVRLLSYISVISIGSLQAHPMRGLNVRDATLSDNFSFVVSMGRIDREGKHFCTGSLITRQSVLTCQHCIAGKNKSNIIITIGSTDLRLGQKYGVADWKSFDQWHFNISELEFSTEDDIAIIKVLLHSWTFGILIYNSWHWVHYGIFIVG